MKHLFYQWFAKESKPVGYSFNKLPQKRDNFIRAIKTVEKSINRIDIQEMILKNYLRK